MVVDYNSHEKVDKGLMGEIGASLDVFGDVEESLAGDGKRGIK